MGRKRCPPPQWWLLGYLAQYQPQALLRQCQEAGLNPDLLYAATESTARSLPSVDYRRLSKAWAVQRSRDRQGGFVA